MGAKLSQIFKGYNQQHLKYGLFVAGGLFAVYCLFSEKDPIKRIKVRKDENGNLD